MGTGPAGILLSSTQYFECFIPPLCIPYTSEKRRTQASLKITTSRNETTRCLFIKKQGPVFSYFAIESLLFEN